MIYTALKWYALTLGAWRYHRWFRSLTPGQQLHETLRRVWANPRLEEQLRAQSPLLNWLDLP